VDVNAFNPFSFVAHQNARTNPNAMFHDKRVTERMVRTSRVIFPPLRLYDAAPVCDGAAAVVLTRSEEVRAYSDHPVRLLGSSVATDWFRIADRRTRSSSRGGQIGRRRLPQGQRQPVRHRFLRGPRRFQHHGLPAARSGRLLPPARWRMAKEGRIKLKGDLPLATFGGLKARGIRSARRLFTRPVKSCSS
jgi:acetyl-CoA C-acetyltransferase